MGNTDLEEAEIRLWEATSVSNIIIKTIEQMPNNSITHSMHKGNARTQHMQPKGKPKRNKVCDSTDRKERWEIEGKDLIQNPAR